MIIFHLLKHHLVNTNSLYHLVLGLTCARLMGIRKAQAFTIRHTGLDQPTSTMGSLRLGASLIVLVIARSLFEGPVRVAIEQIKMYVCIRCTGQNYEISGKRPKEMQTFYAKNVIYANLLC